MDEAGMTKEEQDEWIKNAEEKCGSSENGEVIFNYSEFLVWYVGMKQKKGADFPIIDIPNRTTCPSCQFVYLNIIYRHVQHHLVFHHLNVLFVMINYFHLLLQQQN